jgi:hypothetical protein
MTRLELEMLTVRVHDSSTDEDVRRVARIALAACKLAETVGPVERIVLRAAAIELPAMETD